MKTIKVFGDPNCVKCREMSPILMDIWADGEIDIEFFMVEGNEHLFFEEEIESYPTIRFYNDGTMYDEIIGITTKEIILDKFNEVK